MRNPYASANLFEDSKRHTSQQDRVRCNYGFSIWSHLSIHDVRRYWNIIPQQLIGKFLRASWELFCLPVWSNSCTRVHSSKLCLIYDLVRGDASTCVYICSWRSMPELLLYGDKFDRGVVAWKAQNNRLLEQEMVFKWHMWALANTFSLSAGVPLAWFCSILPDGSIQVFSSVLDVLDEANGDREMRRIFFILPSWWLFDHAGKPSVSLV